MKFLLSALLIAVLSFMPGVAHAAENIVAVILSVEGSGTVTNAEGKTRDASEGSKLHPQDVVTTSEDSKIFIQFIDNTEFTLSENAAFTVDEYNYNPSDSSKNYATYSVMQGAFLYVSGLLAKKSQPDVRVNVPQASIGIRGTKFWGGMIDGSYGVIVGEGKVTVKNKGGSTTLIRGQGTTLKDRMTKPTPPKKWSQEKIARATGTVKLKDPAVLGERMAAAREKQAEQRAEHMAAQVEVKRVPTEVLQQRIEEKMIRLHPEMVPAPKVEEAPAIAPAPVDEKPATRDETTLKQRLENKALNTADQDALLKRLKATETKDLTNTKTTVTETLKPLNNAAARKASAAATAIRTQPGTTTTTTVIEEKTDRATETGARSVTTTTETTKAVIDNTTNTVKSTTDTVRNVTETPVTKDMVQDRVEKALEPASKPLNATKSDEQPATSAIKQFRARALKEPKDNAE